MRSKLILILLILTFISFGVVLAQSSRNFIVQRSGLISGGTSTSANYTASSAIGQPVTGTFGGSQFQGSTGVLFPRQSDLPIDLWLPVIQN